MKLSRLLTVIFLLSISSRVAMSLPQSISLLMSSPPLPSAPIIPSQISPNQKHKSSFSSNGLFPVPISLDLRTASPIPSDTISPTLIANSPISPTPISDGPISSISIADGPISSTSIADGPISTTPIAEGPISSTPISDGPISTTPIADGPISTTPIADGPILSTPIADGPILSTPISDGPISTTPIANGPIVSTPIADGPILSTPIADGPISLTQMSPGMISSTPIYKDKISPTQIPSDLISSTPKMEGTLSDMKSLPQITLDLPSPVLTIFDQMSSPPINSFTLPSDLTHYPLTSSVKTTSVSESRSEIPVFSLPTNAPGGVIKLPLTLATPPPPKNDITRDLETKFDYDILNDLEMPGTSLTERIIAFEGMLCDNTCGSKYPMSSYKEYEPPIHCPVCQCDAKCVQYNDCCPDVYLLKNITQETVSECSLLVPTDSGNVSSSLLSTLINKCPTDNRVPIETARNSQRLKCEKADFSMPSQALPVSDVSTNMSYKNLYCATCNKVNTVDIHQWKFNISCETSFPPRNSFRNNIEYYQKMREDGRCSIRYNPVDKRRYQRMCRKPTQRIIKICNENNSGFPYNYHPDVERACQMYNSLFLNKYKNVFCYLCNVKRNWTISQLIKNVRSMYTSPSHVGRLSFRALVDFKIDMDESNENTGSQEDYDTLEAQCSSTQFFDNLTCSCRDIRCHDWRNYENNTCKGQPQKLNEDMLVGYRICLKVDITFENPPLFKTVEALVKTAFPKFIPSYQSRVAVSKWCPWDTRAVLHMEILETDDGMGDFENTYNEEGSKLCSFIQEQLVFMNESEKHSLKSCAFDVVTATECPSSYATIPCAYQAMNKVWNVEVYNRNRKFIYRGAIFIPYRGLDQCPFVDISDDEFQETEFTLIHQASLHHIEKMKVEFSRYSTFSRICLNDYLRWSRIDTPQCGSNREQVDLSSFDDWTIGGLISIITSCISLFFLFLTFLTYVLFDQIRTRSCVNLMMLTVLLFIAQALYEFTIEQFEYRSLCRFFGVSIHYFWLASIFSMSACTIERFIKLTYPLETLYFFRPSSNTPVIIATLYTFLCPLLIVACNIAVNVAMKNEFGYGSFQICYINGRYSRIFSFVVPMCAVLFINAVLLIITIIKLRRKQDLAEIKTKRISGSRIGLVACVRLSIVTGGTWLVSLLYEVIPIDAMGYVFTAFLGLQGVIFFFSLMGNARILELYLNFLKTGKRFVSSSVGTTGITDLKRGNTSDRVIEERHTASTSIVRSMDAANISSQLD